MTDEGWVIIDAEGRINDGWMVFLLTVYFLFLCGLQESASEGLMSSAGRSLPKHCGCQEGEGSAALLGPAAAGPAPLGLAPLGPAPLGSGKRQLKDKLSAIRQDRAERRESLQKQEAIHEVDSSEDEDDGEGRGAGGHRAIYAPPPLLRPTSIRSGSGGTLPSLCLPPLTFPASSTPAALSAPPSTLELQSGHSKDQKELGPASISLSSPLPFSTPGSAFVSVCRDAILKPPPLSAPKSEPLGPQERLELNRGSKIKTPAPPSAALSTIAARLSPSASISTSGSAPSSPDCSPARPLCSSPGLSKEKKEADNHRLCAAAAAAATSDPAPPGEALWATPQPGAPGVSRGLESAVVRSVLGPVRLSGCEAAPSPPAPPTKTRQRTTLPSNQPCSNPPTAALHSARAVVRPDPLALPTSSPDKAKPDKVNRKTT